MVLFYSWTWCAADNLLNMCLQLPLTTIIMQMNDDDNTEWIFNYCYWQYNSSRIWIFFRFSLSIFVILFNWFPSAFVSVYFYCETTVRRIIVVGGSPFPLAIPNYILIVVSYSLIISSLFLVSSWGSLHTCWWLQNHSRHSNLLIHDKQTKVTLIVVTGGKEKKFVQLPSLPPASVAAVGDCGSWYCCCWCCYCCAGGDLLFLAVLDCGDGGESRNSWTQRMSCKLHPSMGSRSSCRWSFVWRRIINRINRHYSTPSTI